MGVSGWGVDGGWGWNGWMVQAPTQAPHELQQQVVAKAAAAEERRQPPRRRQQAPQHPAQQQHPAPQHPAQQPPRTRTRLQQQPLRLQEQVPSGNVNLKHHEFPTRVGHPTRPVAHIVWHPPPPHPAPPRAAPLCPTPPRMGGRGGGDVDGWDWSGGGVCPRGHGAALSCSPAAAGRRKQRFFCGASFTLTSRGCRVADL